jgi:triacylglycerol lipase
MEHVILCHGWDGRTNLGPMEWQTFAPILMESGYEVWSPSLGKDNVANADIIRRHVSYVPAGETIHIVAHSMGGLSSRYYLKNIDSTRVSTYIALDTPQYGASWWKALWFGNTAQLWSGCQFLKDLNAPDPTPGPVDYVQLTCDYTQILPGAFTKALTGVTHTNMVTDPATLALVVRILQGDYSELVAPNG